MSNRVIILDDRHMIWLEFDRREIHVMTMAPSGTHGIVDSTFDNDADGETIARARAFWLIDCARKRVAA